MNDPKNNGGGPKTPADPKNQEPGQEEEPVAADAGDDAEEAAAAEEAADSQEPPPPAPEELIAELKDQLLRALAETENVRRRADRDRAETSKYAITNFAQDIVTVADNIRRSIESAGGESPDEAGAGALLAGIEMTERDLLATLERHGIRAISPLGERFDHNLHQALFEVPGSDEEPGTVVQVVQTGFSIGDRLLRPAMVGVARAADKATTEGGEEAEEAETGSGPDAGEAGSSLDTEA